MNSKIINSIKQFVIAVLTIVLALAVGAILVRISGNDPAEAYTILFRGALGSKARISEVLVKMIPLTLMALGMCGLQYQGMFGLSLAIELSF